MARRRAAKHGAAGHIVLHAVSIDRIEQAIHTVRGQKVMLDTELAELYGVETRALNQATRRNRNRFPPDFMFQLTEQEKRELITNCDHLAKLRFSHSLPYAFTEHGALMAANVLNSERAVEVSVEIVRVFARLRRMAGAVKELARKIREMERKYDENFAVVFGAIRQLMEPEEEEAPPRGRIGFHRE